MSPEPLPPAPTPDPPPVRPVEPDAADCCGEGCPRCIFDVYDEAMERYEAALAAWSKRHPEPGQVTAATGQPDSDTGSGTALPPPALR